jgi:hypothetical protein
MPPQLTEVWAAAYLQVLATLGVFALGLPAVIYQLVVPDRLRTVAFKWRGRRQTALVVGSAAIFIVCSMLAFIWLLHPRDARVALCAEWLAAIAMSAAITMVGVSWYVLVRSSTADKLIAYLYNKADISDAYSPHVRNDAVADIAYIGSMSSSASGKDTALAALDQLAENVQSHDGYRGNELDELVRAIPMIISDEGNPASDPCLSAAVVALSGCATRARHAEDSTDAVAAVAALGSAAKTAVLQGSEQVALLAAQHTAQYPLVLFGIVECSLGTGRGLAALAALNSLEARWLEDPQDDLRRSTLLGATALLSRVPGEARKRALATYNDVRRASGADARLVMEEARAYHIELGHLETCAALDSMQDLVSALPTSRRERSAARAWAPRRRH